MVHEPQKIITLPLRNFSKYMYKRYIMRRRIAQHKTVGVIKRKQILGKEITLDLEDIEQYYLFERCTREPENYFVYRSLAKQSLCDTFIDIGANYGFVSLSVLPFYQKLILFEPNPIIFKTLQQIYEGEDKVTLINAAIVGEDSPNKLVLKVPKDSSGLGSIEGTHLMREDVYLYECDGLTLKDAVGVEDLSNAYIKIDVEGSEFKILSNIITLINQKRIIVGFESLSREYAKECVNLFKNMNYVFYYGKFDFMSDSGSIVDSKSKLLGSFLGLNKSLSIYKILEYSFEKCPDNFSQIFCVPKEKVLYFEKSLNAEKKLIGELDLQSI